MLQAEQLPAGVANLHAALEDGLQVANMVSYWPLRVPYQKMPGGHLGALSWKTVTRENAAQIAPQLLADVDADRLAHG